MQRFLFVWLLTVLFAGTALSGCTTYTWPDGSRETRAGVPAGDSGKNCDRARLDEANNCNPARLPDRDKR